MFYFNERGDDLSNLRQVGSTGLLRSSGIVNVRNRSYSAFASVTYKLPWLEGLSATGGFRYTKDKRSGTALQTVNGACNLKLTNGSFICGLPGEVSYSKPSWTLSLNYQASPDALLYVAHRRGYRAGGLQNRVSIESAAVPFEPETVNDVEVGAKLDFDIGFPARVNIAAYSAWYKNLQRVQSLTLPGTTTLVSLTFNAAAGKTKGIEIETTLKPTSRLTLTGGFALTDMIYSKYFFGGVDVSHQNYSYVPKYTADASAAYVLPIAEQLGTVTLSGNVHYQSNIQIADVPKPFFILPGYTLVNARMEWSNLLNSNFSASVFANNLLNEAYFPSGASITDSLGAAVRVVGAPRMYGIQVRYEF
nr:TonB-dependent receptor [Novosphingobium sp. G106]